MRLYGHRMLSNQPLKYFKTFLTNWVQVSATKCWYVGPIEYSDVRQQASEVVYKQTETYRLPVQVGSVLYGEVSAPHSPALQGVSPCPSSTRYDYNALTLSYRTLTLRERKGCWSMKVHSPGRYSTEKSWVRTCRTTSSCGRLSTVNILYRCWGHLSVTCAMSVSSVPSHFRGGQHPISPLSSRLTCTRHVLCFWAYMLLFRHM